MEHRNLHYSPTLRPRQSRHFDAPPPMDARTPLVARHRQWQWATAIPRPAMPPVCSHYDFSQDLTMKGPQAANCCLNSFIPTIPTFQLRLSPPVFEHHRQANSDIHRSMLFWTTRSVHTLYYESRCSELYNSVLFFPESLSFCLGVV
ncbi:hypothetical protein PVAP13_3KG142900 [Panicum virgatum]|uniref:Uncharacterized protein n=1 Tax=Panicum virgatum TaxID=38727 RepID=A0A8T0UPI4_PANVG|nr:hypothetical protein PVAP13_3KG142900 [Panicum virgatum]